MDPKIRNEARGERTPHAHRSSFPLPFDNFVKLVSKASVTSREKKKVNISQCVPRISSFQMAGFHSRDFPCISIQMLPGTQHKHLDMTRARVPSDTEDTVYHELFMIPKSQCNKIASSLSCFIFFSANKFPPIKLVSNLQCFATDIVHDCLAQQEKKLIIYYDKEYSCEQ